MLLNNTAIAYLEGGFVRGPLYIGAVHADAKKCCLVDESALWALDELLSRDLGLEMRNQMFPLGQPFGVWQGGPDQVLQGRRLTRGPHNVQSLLRFELLGSLCAISRNVVPGKAVLAKMCVDPSNADWRLATELRSTETMVMRG